MPPNPRRIDLRILSIHTPSAADLERARELPRTACPRRHCWWWHSAAFDWDTPVSKGCTYPQSEYAQLSGDQSPCKRCDATSQSDHFESRSPEDDGFTEQHWRPDSNHT